jgi:hypothetical protein
MTSDEHEKLTQYLELCRRIYERMREEKSWPWADSPESEDVIDSQDKTQ